MSSATPASALTPVVRGAAPPPPYVRDIRETSVCAWWMGDPDAAGWILRIREFPKPWADAKEMSLPMTTTEHVVSGLAPTSTYMLALVREHADGSRSPASEPTSVDTLAAGCVPKDEEGNKRKDGCAVM